MDTLYEVILNFLNQFFPSAIQSTWGNINELIAYLCSWLLLYVFIIKPLFGCFDSLTNWFAPKKRGK